MKLMCALAIILLALAPRTCAAQSAMRQERGHFTAQGHTAYFNPPFVYDQWWHEMEHCAHAEANMASWKFVAVAADVFTVAEDTSHTLLFGATLEDIRRIYYVLPNIHTRARVQHEMLHAILHDSGRPWQHHDPLNPTKPDADDVFQRCNYR